MIRTTAVLWRSWSRFGQLTRLSSPWTSRANFRGPAAKPCFFFCCVPLAPLVAVEPRLLPIFSSPDLVRPSRAGGTRTPDLRFWRPLLYQLSYCPLPRILTGLPVRRMLPAPRAELPQLDAVRGVAPVLTGVVVPALALLASQRYQLSHSYPPDHRGELSPTPANRPSCLRLYLGDDAGSHSASTLPDGKVQALIHRYGTDQLYFHYSVVSRHHHLYALF